MKIAFYITEKDFIRCINLYVKNREEVTSTGHSTYFETKYKSFFSFIFKQLLQKMFEMGTMSIVN